MNSSTSGPFTKLLISLKLANNEKDAQIVLWGIFVIVIAIAAGIYFLSQSSSSKNSVPQAQLQQSIMKMKETNVVPIQHQ